MAEDVQAQSNAPAAEAAGPNISEIYARATKLNAKLASSTDAQLMSEGRLVAQQLIDYVRKRVPGFDDFVKRVHVAEEFSLTESRQVPKTEKELKLYYLCGESLLEAVQESEQRAQRKRK